MSDLLADLGLEFVNPNTISKSLKALKPQEDAQIFSVILSVPGLENTVIKYKRHNFYNQLKKNIRCSGGSCCIKAEELNTWLAKLPDDDERKRQKPRAQTRYIIPVVLYQGKTAQSYGGPIEIRYIDISESTYISWDQGRQAVNEDSCPYYQRDFIMTQDPKIKQVPVMTHLENRAKWTVDPALQAEVQAILSNPNFINDYVKIVPPKMSEEEFLSAWKVAMSQPQQTIAERVVAQQTQTIQPALQPTIQPVDMSSINVQPQQVNVAPTQNQVPLNLGLPVNATPVQQPVQENVAYTPQNLINGTYNVPPVVNTISPENIVNMQPVTLAPAEVVEQVTTQPVQATPVETPTTQPTTTQNEISLANIGDLDSIINSLPQQ